MEFHGYWNLPCAIRIAQALEPFSPMWLEEMLPQDNLAPIAELARATRLPLCVSERLMTRWGFRELFDNARPASSCPNLPGAAASPRPRRSRRWRRLHYLPVAPHNCGGPVLHLASAHLAANVTNLYIMETRPQALPRGVPRHRERYLARRERMRPDPQGAGPRRGTRPCRAVAGRPAGGACHGEGRRSITDSPAVPWPAELRPAGKRAQLTKTFCVAGPRPLRSGGASRFSTSPQARLSQPGADLNVLRIQARARARANRP